MNPLILIAARCGSSVSIPSISTLQYANKHQGYRKNISAKIALHPVCVLAVDDSGVGGDGDDSNDNNKKKNDYNVFFMA